MKIRILSAIVLIASVSCTKLSTDEPHRATDERQPTVSIRFASEPAEPGTKAFFDSSTETWEKALGTLTVLVFDNTGALMVQRDFTSAEPSAKKALFAIPKGTAGTTCDFYAVANTPVANITTKTGLLALLESSAADYNGTFAEVTTKARRAGGFVMSGSATKSLAATGSQTDVTVALKRTVAKVALQVSLASDFASKYRGAVRINSVKLSTAAMQTPVIKPARPSTGGMNSSFTQTPNTVSNTYQNLFYIYENGALGIGSRVLLEMNATYDLDGNYSTTGDQAAMTYSVELDGKTGGQIERKGYYKVNAVLNGLVGNNVSVTVSVADWETPVTQSVNLGQ